MLSGLRRSSSFRTAIKRAFPNETRLINTTCRIQDGTQHINIDEYDYTVSRLRSFFKVRGWKEVNTQYRKSILAACEDPWTISTFEYEGEKWPLPQTGQMWLEHDLLKNPKLPGVFTISTSYRAEPNPIPGRHQTIFPMFEFEGRGDMAALRTMEQDLLEFIGFGKNKNFAFLNYNEASKECGKDDIGDREERKLCREHGSVVFLEHFPEYTHPFWNMYWEKHDIERFVDGKKVNQTIDHARKIDVIIHGQETIGSAERETRPEIMRERFETTSNGAYAKKIRDLFGEERVDRELDDFLCLRFCRRYGGGIGIHRLIQGMVKEGVMLPNSLSSYSPNFNMDAT